ncbi:MAG: hypothetical protein GY839_05395 [candidate division Zixibacteria bacterium]|nr:hypothetical protein [candidate division Zixibacteria bacterium]
MNSAENNIYRLTLLIVMLLPIVGLTQELIEDPYEGSVDSAEISYIISGRYVGQEPPTTEPELFAPDIISVEGIQHCFPAFSPDAKEVYWTTITEGIRPKIMFMEEIGGQWTSPEVAPFSGEYGDFAPVFSRDGQRLYFASSRPDGYGKKDIWYVEKSMFGWGQPENLGSPPNSAENETQPSLTEDGTLYFVRTLKGVEWNRGIFRSRNVNGIYLKPRRLNKIINTKHADIYPYIAPDESYLMFGSNRPGSKSKETDIYISFRKDDGSWTKPQNIGEAVNDGYSVSFPYITIDGKYLFFNRFNESKTDAFYWVDSEIIEQFEIENMLR